MATQRPTTTNTERFQLRESPSPDARTLSKHATREEADKALHDAQQQTPGNYIIVDMGVPDPQAKAAAEAREAAKSADQKAADRANDEASQDASKDNDKNKT